MPEHFQAFIESFVGKRHKKGLLYTVARTKRDDNPMLGMDALHRELDERYCIQLPKGSKQKDIDFVKAALLKYKSSTCFVLSAYEKWNEQTMAIDDALEEIVGSTSTTIISFIPGTLAYFEGHSPGDRWLCVRNELVKQPK